MPHTIPSLPDFTHVLAVDIGGTKVDAAVVSLPAHRSAPENAATARRRVEVISGSLRRLEAALTGLSDVQAQSLPEMTALLARIIDFERRVAGPAA